MHVLCPMAELHSIFSHLLSDPLPFFYASAEIKELLFSSLGKPIFPHAAQVISVARAVRGIFRHGNA